MDAILSSLNAIEGVTGCAVFDANGTCVAHAVPPPYEPILLTNVMDELKEAFNLYHSTEQAAKLQTFVAKFDYGYVVVRWVEDLIIMAMAASTVNMAMLSVGLNVAQLKISRAQRGSGASSLPYQSDVPPISRSQSGASPMPMPASSPGRLSSSPVVDIQEVPPDAVSPQVVTLLLRAIARQIGPFAKVILKEELTRLGVSAQTLGRGQYADLVGMIARRIGDPDRQKEFVVEAEDLPDE